MRMSAMTARRTASYRQVRTSNDTFVVEREVQLVGST
jgi:hypothetical protein